MCDKCKAKQNIELTGKGIEDLLRIGYIDVNCVNSSCRDKFRSLGIRVTLKDLIAARIL